LKPFDVRIVVMEATGKYHRAIHGFLHDAGLAAAVVNPLRARLFAESIGVLAKTDSVDARMLAAFGLMAGLAATPPLRGACCHSLLGMRLRPESPSSPAP
jgi:transposase